MTGVVVKNTGSWYIVRTDDGQLFQCKLKGNFRIKGIRTTNPVAVGDVVDFTSSLPLRECQGGSFITSIHPRRNYIIRKASNLSKESHILAANIDQAALLVTLRHPETSLTFIDRFLATAEAYSIPVLLIFNKIDLLDAEDTHILDMLCTLYESLGYKCFRISALQETPQPDKEGLRSHLSGKVTLLSGNSGVGKTTLLNALIPGLDARTADISDAHDTGMHTTTFSEMYDLEPLEPFEPIESLKPTPSGSLIDTPGIKGFGTFDMEPEEVGHYFREIFRYSSQCRFSNCTHTHEPGCAILKALDEHLIAQSRYHSYLSMLTDKDQDKYRQAPS